MADIVLCTLNAKYAHTAFGLRYLLANLGPLQGRATLLEFNINQRPLDMAEAILAQSPRIVGLGVYIWNVAQTTQLVGLLKALQPDIVVVLGGPEVSYETTEQAIVAMSDHVVTGEGEVTFRWLCEQLLGDVPVPHKILVGQSPDIATLELPYGLYSDQDIQQRVLYVEASRGCPYRCEFCLSSLDTSVRRFDLEKFLPALKRLLDRGAKQFKFIDRTFNLQPAASTRILQFFLDHAGQDVFLHFEMVPDRLPDALRGLISQFPKGTLQFEIGVQTFNPEVQKRISRRQDMAKLQDNLRFLKEKTGVHVHADLIAGLPGENSASFAEGFDALVALGPQEIQVGILKRLRGTPIIRHTEAFGMVYNPEAPYDVLRTNDIDFASLQAFKRFARYWDMVVNSGNFRESAPLIWRGGTPFADFWEFSQFMDRLVGKTHGIALDRLAELMLRFLSEQGRVSEAVARQALLADYHRGARRRTPAFLAVVGPQAAVEKTIVLPRKSAISSVLPRRQARHWASS